MNRRLLLMPFLLSIILAGGLLPIRAATGAWYDIGAPVLTDLFVSPIGSDNNPGTTREQPLKTKVILMSAQVGRYNSVIAQTAAQYGALVVDFYQTTVFTDPGTLAADGNHPNAAGYDMVARRWYDTLKPLLGG